MSVRDAIIAEARTWIGTPYHHHGRIKGVGVDCAQLLCAVYESVGLTTHVDPGFYPVDWHLHRGEELFADTLNRYANPGDGDLQKGDICLFRFGRTFSHGAIHIGDGLFVHAYHRLGVIVSSFREEPLLNREMSHWRIL